MTDNNMKDLENTNLTDEQTAEVAGGFPVCSRPFPRNAKLEDKQTEQVSGGRRRPRTKKLDEDESSGEGNNPGEVSRQSLLRPW